jgi:hypothetical protein
VRWGRLAVSTLSFEVSERPDAPTVTVRVAGRRVGATARVAGKRLHVELARRLIIEAGQTLEVSVA